MPTTVNLCLRSGSRPTPVDLDTLSPRARALAEACAQRLGGTCVIWLESGRTVRELIPGAERYYGADELDQPYRMGWSGWSRYPEDSQMSQADYLERQARRIPPHYTIIGAFPGRPVPSSGDASADQGMTRTQVLAYLEARGRKIAPSTWDVYVVRRQAPAPDRRVGRTPLWDPETIDTWLGRERHPGRRSPESGGTTAYTRDEA